MKRRLLWVCGVVAALLIVVGLGMWLGGMSARNQIIRLTREAKEAGLVFEPVQNPPNPKAEAIRRKINALRDKRDGKTTIYSDTENVAEMALLIERDKDIHDLAIELSNCTSYGRGDDNLYLETLRGLTPLIVRGNFAVTQGDVSALLASATAMRRLSNLMPRQESVACIVAEMFLYEYATLLQSGAEAFANNIDALIAIEAEARQWKEGSFEDAARHQIGEILRWIDEAAKEDPNESVWDTLQRWAANARNESDREKIAALKQMIEVCGRWQDDAFILGTDHGGGSHERYWHAGSLKEQEILAVSYLRSLALTLRARTIKAKTGHWPSIEELAASGLNTLDPILRRPYRWQVFEGNQRILGSRFGGETPIEDFVLLTGPERLRSPYQSKY
ncbi:MAG: hypothetical protein M3R13_11075 [Armatimonadota bacterium]|nr:hypothetical protein [Armatimonadota bacterium]